MTRACALALLAAPIIGCSGDVSAPSGPGSGNYDVGNNARQVTFACGGSDVPGAPLSRLSRLQYENTLHDLLRAELPAAADEIWQRVVPLIAALPADTTSKVAPFATMDQATSQSHVDTYYRVGSAIAQALTADDARIDALLSCDAGQSESDCVDAFLRRFGRRAYRHALSESELDFMLESYEASGIDAEALRDVIATTLNSAPFLYRIELGDQPIANEPNAYRLSAYEVVARLSYHYWQSTPSDELLAAAESGALDTDEGYRALLDKVIDDPRTSAGLRTFVREWLHLDALRPLDALVGDPVFDSFVGADAPSPALREAMIDDVLASFVFHAQRDDSFADWFASPYSFARDPALAAIYRVPTWDGTGEPPRFPAGERAGLLTRGALLATGTTNTRPIMRGVFVRERVLCDHLSPPPANATNLPADTTAMMSTREVVEKLTEGPGSSCAACHATMINPLGFALEGFDALGRKRTSETLFTADGTPRAQKPVNSTSKPHVWLDDDTRADGASDLSELILESGKAEACFARQYIRFAYGRTEDEQVDGCALEAVRSALQEGQGLRQALRAPALRPEFRQRFIGEVP